MDGYAPIADHFIATPSSALLLLLIAAFQFV
jgi:hypothetical protein